MTKSRRSELQPANIVAVAESDRSYMDENHASNR
jgi:hypothetical protein